MKFVKDRMTEYVGVQRTAHVIPQLNALNSDPSTQNPEPER